MSCWMYFNTWQFFVYTWIHTFVDARSGVTDLLPFGFWGSSIIGVVNGEEVTDVSDFTDEAVSKGGFLLTVVSLGYIKLKIKLKQKYLWWKINIVQPPSY